MDIASPNTSNFTALSAYLAKVKAEQATAAKAGTQDLKSLGAQLVQSLQDDFQNSQAGDPLAQLLNPSSTSSTDPLANLLGGTSSSSLSGTDLAALLAKTQPGPAGNKDRAALVASLIGGGSQTSGTDGQGGTSLFNFLG